MSVATKAKSKKKSPVKAEKKPSPKSKVTEESAVSTLGEAEIVNSRIDGNEHRLAGLKEEVKTIRDAIKGDTKYLREIVRDAKAGQNRLPLGSPNSKPEKPAPVKLDDLDVGGTLETTIEGVTLRVTRERDGFASILVEGSEEPQRVGLFTTLKTAQEDLLSEVGYSSKTKPEWRPVQPVSESKPKE